MVQGSGEDIVAPIIDGFTLNEVIGRGGFSRVYRARQHSVGGREVAIKVLDQGFRTDEDRRLFESECLVAGRLDHPNIVRVYQATMTHDGRGCIVMERMAGTYGTNERLSIAELVNVGVKIADVIDEAHRHGIIHQDLKPSNLFKSNRGEPALGDFGIATIAGRQPGKIRMTLRYAPPEKLSEAISDASGDIYSFGATMYELAAQTPPYVGETDEQLIRSIVFDPVPKLERFDAPPAFTSLLRRCMAKDPAERPTSREVVDELRRIQAAVGAPRHIDVVPGPGLEMRPAAPAAPERHDRTFADEELGRRARQSVPSGMVEPAEVGKGKRWLMPLVGVATVAVLSIAAWLIWRGDPISGEPASSTTATEPTTTVAYVVASPPSDFAVTRTASGFTFTWTTDVPGAEVWIYRVGSDDKTAASTSPFDWNIPPSTGGNCFEARTVLAGGGGLSQGTSQTVCA